MHAASDILNTHYIMQNIAVMPPHEKHVGVFLGLYAPLCEAYVPLYLRMGIEKKLNVYRLPIIISTLKYILCSNSSG